MRAEVALCLLVENYDVAIDFYCRKLGLFNVDADNDFGNGQRFVFLAFADPYFAFTIHLQRPEGDSINLIGKQAGKYIFASFPIADADMMLTRLIAERIETENGIIELPYGKQIIIHDHLGNRISLFQRYLEND
jgi:catechol 2,3-dioxygenase-like lactoylglutathione lyase family enzyme